jgi:TetR/AcrR family transcriptional regulator, cholesterol catabolism regulator
MSGTASTSARRTGTRAAETAARKARLLAAATELAREGGYDAVQMRDVAARAEVALGTLYRHYSSKDQLLLAAMLDQTETLRTRIDQRPPREGTAASRVSDVLRRACRALEREPRVTAAFVSAMFSSDPDARGVKIAIGEQLQGIIETAVNGDAPPHADVAAVVDVLGHVWMASMAFWAGGLSDAATMSDRLVRAAELLLA